MTKIQLKYPTDFDGKTVTEIEFQRLKGKHIKKFPHEPSTEDLMRLACKVSDFPLPFFDELDAVDIITVAETMGDFLGGGRETGLN